MKYQIFNDDLPNDLLTRFRQEQLLAVDVETTGLNMFRDEVCTIQISDGVSNNIIIKINIKNYLVPGNLKSILENKNVRKVFHNAPFDVCMIYQSLNINVNNFQCLKVMSKIVRTYADKHGLKDLAEEFGIEKINKFIQQSCWFGDGLSPDQEKYAIKDVIYIVHLYDKLHQMIKRRGQLRSGLSCSDLHENAQEAMRNMIPLLTSGYGSPDNNWDLGWLFRH